MNLELLAPYEVSPTVILLCALAAGAYLRGLYRLRVDGERVAVWRSLSFFAGLTLTYAVLQTHLDYLAQFMFWIHRAQHLVLHHLGPFLILLARPGRVLAAGLSRPVMDRVVGPAWRAGPVRAVYRTVQQPFVASVLFVGLIFFWLVPSVHFDAMLSLELYKLMNWSMVVDGLLFWWLIVDPRGRERGGLGFGVRLIMLWAIMLPQIALGAYIGLSRTPLYAVYEVCGRAWPVSPLVDQQLGGLITWIPAAMMSVLGALVVLGYWLRERPGDARDDRPARLAPG